MVKACNRRRFKRVTEFIKPGACVAVKMSKDSFARGILKDDDRPLEKQTGAVTVLLHREDDTRYVAPVKLHSIHSCSVYHVRETPQVLEFCDVEHVLSLRASVEALTNPTCAALLSMISFFSGIAKY